MQPTTSESQKGLYGQMVATKPSGAPKFRSLAKDLDVFGAADLYEYSCPKGVANPRGASSESLVGAADVRVNDYGKITPERSAAERLRSRAREIFGDESERQRYDAYLRWAALKGVFDALDQASRSGAAVGDAAVADARTALKGILGDDATVQALLEDYDENYGGNLEFAKHEGQPQPAAQAARPAVQPQLEMTCPSCGTKVKHGSRFCSNCRYDFALRTATTPSPVRIVTPPQQVASLPPTVVPQQEQAKWPTVVIIVAIIVIIVSVGVICSTLSGAA